MPQYAPNTQKKDREKALEQRKKEQQAKAERLLKAPSVSSSESISVEGMPMYLRVASQQGEQSTDRPLDTEHQISEQTSAPTQDSRQRSESQSETAEKKDKVSTARNTSQKSESDISAQLPKARSRATMQKEVAEATTEPQVTTQKTEGSPIFLVPSELQPAPPQPSVQSSPHRSNPSQINTPGMPSQGMGQPQTPKTPGKDPLAGIQAKTGQKDAAPSERSTHAKDKSTKGQSTKEAVQSPGERTGGQVASRSASEPVAGATAGAALVPPVAPDALRSQIPQRELTEEEVSTALAHDRTPEQDRAEVQQLLAAFQTEAEQEKLSILAEIETQKAAIATHSEMQVGEIQTTIATQIRTIQAQFASVHAAMTSHAEQQKVVLQAEVEQDVIQLQTATVQRIAQADTQFSQRQTSLTTFAEQQQQQPQTIAQQEASRADSKLEAAALECEQAGDAEAARYGGHDDPKPEQRTAAREVARQSAVDIREKKPAIAKDLRSRAEEFGGKYLEYAISISTQITQARETLIPEIEGTALSAETSLRGTVDAALAAIDARLATELQALETAESDSNTRLQSSGDNAIAQVRSGANQASTEVDTAGTALVVEIDRGIEETTTVVSSEAEPFLPGIRDVIESGRAAMLITSTSGRAQLGTSASTAHDSLSEVTFSFARQASELVSVAQTSAERVQSQAQTAIAQSLESRRQQGQEILAGAATQQQEMINAVLAEVDRANEQVKQEMSGITEQCRTELTSATNESITQAIKPRTDQVETRAHEAAEQIDESWLVGLGRAVGQILIGIVILVVVALVVAAIAAAFGVILTAWTAIMIAGAILLAVGLIMSLIHRSGQRELQGRPVMIIVLALGDTVGVVGIIEGISGNDIVTGQDLTDAEQTERGVLGAVTFISLVVGVRSAIKGPPGGVYYTRPIGGVKPGWLPSGEIVPGWRAIFTRAGQGTKSVAQGLWAGARQGVRDFREWLSERLKSEENPSNPREADPARPRPASDPNVIEVDSPQRIKATEPEWVWDDTYGAEVWRWFLYDEISGARFCEVNVRASSSTAPPQSGPELTLNVKQATLPNGQQVSLRSKGFSWTPESLRAAIETFIRRFGNRPSNMGGELAWDNLSNFQKEFARIRAENPGMSDEAIANEAIRHISFGSHRILIGYGDFSVRASNFGDVSLKNGPVLENVPNHVEIDARPTPSTGTPVIPGRTPDDQDPN